ncbi:MAG: WYL domain-containing protein [Betaproteobacteria bacterium]|nr:WYL domain-containing protein [Betaproteobacteria bacterium]
MKTVTSRGLFPTAAEELKWDVRQRLAMLEATVLWEVRVTTAALTRLFGISRGQASKDFSLYQRLAPDNLLYDLHLKAYRASGSFAPRFMLGTAEEFLLLAEAGSALGRSVVVPITPGCVAVETLRPPARTADLGVLRAMHGAIRAGQRISAPYHSLTRETRSLELEPHALVFNGFRWHVRAWCAEHGDFRDFVLGRFPAVPVEVGPARHGAADDDDWQYWETLQIEPHPGLSLKQQAAIADDYGMEDGRLLLTVRRALVSYVLSMLRLDGSAPSDPKAAQLVLSARQAAKAPRAGSNRGY